MRLSDPDKKPTEFIDKVVCGDARKVMRQLPDECVALAVTSPPYWNMVDYGAEGQIGQTSYEQYLGDLLVVWRETCRVLVPNGKLAIVSPIMPIAKSVIGEQHTRHLKNLNNDIEQTILNAIPKLYRYSLFVWQKQTTEKMFGSYPYPPNIYEDNTIEFISVYVKEGAPLPVPEAAKESSKLTQDQWLNLTMQVWPMYPQDVRRAGGHPCPFPAVLPQRLIMMYTFAGEPKAGFEGDFVLDMFCGTGATCEAARVQGRHFLGIDISERYCETARKRVGKPATLRGNIMLNRVAVNKPRLHQQSPLWAKEETQRGVEGTPNTRHHDETAQGRPGLRAQRGC